MNSSFRNAIVKIISPDEHAVGTGFLVTDQLVATCAHVIQNARVKQGDIVRVAFWNPSTPENINTNDSTGYFNARVDNDSWRDPKSVDIAILRFEEPLQNGRIPVLLGSSRGISGHAFETFGFPDIQNLPGLSGRGNIQGEAILDRMRVLQLSSTDVTSGFSGAPVYDTITRRIVGMVNSFLKPDQFGKMGDVVFATPIEAIMEACPGLQISELCPYRSLNVFEEADAEFFHGRQSFIDQLLDCLKREPRFLAVLGPSGSGKSSVVRAGLIPQLRLGKVPGSDRWDILVTRPSDNPFQQLVEVGLVGATDKLDAAVQSWLTTRSDSTRLLVVIDQFEELLTITPESLRRAFVQQLAGLLDTNQPVTIILILRDDFYSQFALQATELVSWLERELVNSPLILTRDELHAIIEEPAGDIGLSFESGLSEVIVKDVLAANPTGTTGQSTILPLLEFTLTQLWKYKQDSVLTHSAYSAKGGVIGSLTQWADRAYYALDPNQRKLAEYILTNLVNLGDESQGLPDSRRRLPLSKLCRTESDYEEVHSVVRYLANNRLLVTGDGETVELIHDALVREWGTLRSWLHENRSFLTWQQKIKERVYTWVETNPANVSKRDKSKLLRGRDLVVAEGWFREHRLDLGLPEREYIQAGIRYARQMKRITVSGVVTAFLMVFLTAVIFLSQRNAVIQANETMSVEVSIRGTAQAIAIAQQATAQAANTQSVIDLNQRATAEARAITQQVIAQVANTQSVLDLNQRSTAEAHAITQQAIAVTNEANAIRAALVSNSLALAAYAQNASANDNPDLAIALALEAIKIQDPPVQSQKVFSEIVFAPGTRRVIGGNIKEGVIHAIFSPDGRFILSGDGESNVQLWDAATGQEIRRLGDHVTDETEIKPIVVGLAFSTDGLIAISAGGNDVRFWDVQTGRELRRINLSKVKGGSGSTAAFSSDSRLMLFGDWSGSVHLCNLETGLISEVGHHSDKVNSVVFNSDNTMALSGSDDRTAILWDLQKGKEIRRFKLEGVLVAGKTIASVAFSPDNQTIAVGTANELIYLFDIQTGQEIRQFESDTLIASGLVFNPDGQMIAAASHDRSIRVFDAKTGVQKIRFTGHKSTIYTIAFSSDGSQIVSGSEDNTLRLWDLSQGAEYYSLRSHVAKVSSLSLTTNGEYLLSGSWDGSLRLWDIKTSQVIQQIKPDDNTTIVRSSISPDGSFILASTPYGVSLYDAQTGHEIRRFKNTGQAFGLGFGHESNTIYTVGGFFLSGLTSPDGSMQLWDIETGNELYRFFDLGVSALNWAGVISPDGQIAALGAIRSTMPLFMQGGLMLWDIHKHQKIMDVKGLDSGQMIFCLAFSPDGKMLLAGTTDNMIILFDVETGKRLRTYQGHTGSVTGVAFNPEGHTFMSGSLDGSTRLWDIESSQEIRRYDSDSPVWSVAFSPDGRTIFSGSESGLINVWSISSSIQDFRDWANQNRYIRELTCLERDQYSVQPHCDENGNIPTPIAAIETPTSTPTITPTPLSTQTLAPQSAFIYSKEITSNYSGSAQLWSFMVEKDERVTILARSKVIDSYLILKGPRGELLSINDDFEIGISNDASIRGILIPETGRYSIIVDRFCDISSDVYGIGSYSLSIIVESNTPGKTLELLEQERGRFGFSWVREEETNNIEVSSIAVDGPADVAGLEVGDIIMLVDGKNISEMNQRALWDSLIVPIEASIEFRIKRGELTIDLQMTALRTNENAAWQTLPKKLVLGKKSYGSLDKGESDTWEFDGTAGQTILIVTGGEEVLISSMILQSPNGMVLVKGGELNDEAGWLLWRWNALFPTITLPETGVYTLTVTSQNGTAGSVYYTLLVQQLESIGILSPGKVTNGILPPNAGHYWKFDGNAKEIVTIKLDQQNSMLEPFIFLLGPDNNLLSQIGVDGFDKFSVEYDPTANREIAIANFVLPVSGEYTVIVSPYVRYNPIPENLAGSYTISLNIAELTPVETVMPGQPVSGTLSAGGVVYYIYKGRVGEKITIHLDAENPASQVGEESFKKAIELGLLDTYVVVYGPDMSILAENDDRKGEATTNSEVELQLPVDGTYIIAVSGDRYLTGGNFTLLIQTEIQESFNLYQFYPVYFPIWHKGWTVQIYAC